MPIVLYTVTYIETVHIGIEVVPHEEQCKSQVRPFGGCVVHYPHSKKK